MSPELKQAASGLRVMLVDDDPFQLRLLRLHFEQLSAAAVSAFDTARAALDHLKNQGPHGADLLVCDLQMPDMDGVEFLRHVANADYRGLVLVVSGEDLRILRTVEILGRAHGLRMVGGVAKPVGVQELAQLLQHSRARLETSASTLPGGADAPGRDDGPTVAEIQEACRSHQWLAYFQPKVELASGRWVGLEALVRWQHPRLGLVFPDAFIDKTEEAGLIGELTYSLLQGEQGVLAHMRRWRDQGLPLQVAVNLSMAMLTDPRLPDRLQALMDKAGLPPASLILEVTETRLMRDVRTVLDILARMRLKRFGLSIDDFGTGHSTLAQLRDVPFGELKVDRSFVRAAHIRPELNALLQASVRLGQQMGMKTVAEGVETVEDWNHLRTLGCDMAQGYFVGRPMPADALPAWAKAWDARRPALTA